MSQRPPKILLYECEPDLIELLVASLTRRFNSHLTCVADVEMCVDTDMVDPHDLAIVDAGEAHDQGLRLCADLLTLSPRPVLLMMDAPSSDALLRAMRLGVSDVFPKPFPVGELLDSAARYLRRYALERARSSKYARMRDMVRRVVRERRDLNRRMDLVCRDLVEAQRRLVDRVLDLEGKLIQIAGPASS